MLLGLERLGILRESPSREKRVDWVSGACMMVRSASFKSLGGFNEKFFMYFEDMEICYRAKLNNFSTYFYSNVDLLHKELGSGNRTFAIVSIYKGISYFYKEYKPHWEYLVLVFLLKLKAAVLFLFGVIISNKYLKGTYLTAYKSL